MPHSVVFDDKYFCKENGYEETLYVSCEGNSLKERFSKLDPSRSGTFTIIETGFGTGLNFSCAWSIWDKYAPQSWTLHFISLELYPISTEQLTRALSLWPALAKYKDALSAQYKPYSEGIKDFYFNDVRVHLTIVFDHVIAALRKIKEEGVSTQGADAWFMDGFAPSKNPEMWTDAVFEGMARLSRKGTTLATFTVAGFVRRGLESQGFEVRKIKGYGTKKHVLVGVFK